MMLIEVVHPRGALGPEDRTLVATCILDVLLADGHAPEETMRRARAMTHIHFREADGWHSGDGPPQPDRAPPLIITFTVPEAWREDVSRHSTGIMRAAVRRLDADRGWKREQGHLWINVLGVPDGSIGLDGKASTADDVLAHMTEEFRAAQAAGTARPVPDGKLVDPVCGMLVTPGRDAVILEHRGETVGFCSSGCRDHHVRENALA